MKEQWLTLFPTKAPCLESKSVSFGVKDDLENAPAYIVQATAEQITIFKSPSDLDLDFNDWHFFADNPTQQYVHFLAIDNCWLSSEQGGQCDFALFTEKEFILVDIKDVKTKMRKMAKKKAIEQLYHTLEILHHKNVFPFDLQRFAIVGLTFRDYYHQGHPKARTQVASDIKRFQDDFQTDLLIANAFEFK
jgi:hypothetical protein